MGDNWKFLSSEEEKTKFYVTPFNFSQSEIDYNNITSPIDGLTFYYINS